MKILLVILDGGGDTGEKTPYQIAHKPNMDSLAKRGKCGLIDIGYKKTPQSDLGYLNLLGFYSDETYPGRGYLESLGVGMEDIGENDLCIRGNFATLGTNGNIVDRRAGRDETGLDELAEKVDGMEVDGVRFSVKRSAGHRVVVVMRALDQKTELSGELTSNDPEKTEVPVMQIKPKRPKAKLTASILNRFVAKTNKILSEELVNRERELPANVFLLRGFGKKKAIETFKEKYGMNACCIAGIPIVKGVASFLGFDIITVPGATGYPDTDLGAKFRKTSEALQKYDFALLHINGTDILSHDARRKEKAGFVERIDKNLGNLMKQVDLKETVIIITSDHRTSSEPDYPHYRHTKDPNPALISGGGVEPDRIEKFDEKSCAGGFFIKGNGLLPFLLKQVK